uniref:alpha-1,2-Mannosidase n=1 Tax=Globodera pallida TaxID=36090 RepID=A0A183CEC7_GLOPA
MPQFAHLLRSSDTDAHTHQLPFIVRTSSRTSMGNNLLSRLAQFFSRRRGLYALIIVLLVLSLLYIQFFAFPSELQHMDEAISLKNRERFHPPKGTGRRTGDEPQHHQLQNSDEFHPRKQVVAPKLTTFEGPSNARQAAVRDAFLYAWNAYKKYAWGRDQLMPVSHSYQEWIECGLTIVDSLDTLLIMNLRDEFADAMRWVERELRFDRNRFVSLFETTIRVLGGLLSAYHLSGEQILLTKAEDIGQRLFPAISQSPTAVPYSDVNLHSGTYRQPTWSVDSTLAEIASIQLEFRDLARLTGNSTYEQLSFRVSENIHESACVQTNNGLCGMFLSPQTGQFKDFGTITFGARADSYYEYLLKQWLQTGKTVDWLIDDYKKAMESMRKRLWRRSTPNSLHFVGELTANDQFSPKMDHLTCFLAGTLALGTQHGMPSVHMEMARNLSATCHAMYANPTGLGPEIAWFNVEGAVLTQLSDEKVGERKAAPDLYIKPLDAHSLLRPEAFEAWFYMYRLTGDKQYQDWGWDAFQAIEQYAKRPNGDGYASVQNVKRIPVQHRDLMESFFLAESLKYLYLLLADDQQMLPLDQWVFNTEAHPLPIRTH